MLYNVISYHDSNDPPYILPCLWDVWNIFLVLRCYPQKIKSREWNLRKVVLQRGNKFSDITNRCIHPQAEFNWRQTFHETFNLAKFREILQRKRNLHHKTAPTIKTALTMFIFRREKIFHMQSSETVFVLKQDIIHPAHVEGKKCDDDETSTMKSGYEKYANHSGIKALWTVTRIWM